MAVRCTFHNEKGGYAMTSRETKKKVAEMKAFTKQLTPETARELLVKAGICTTAGELTKPYRQDV